VNGRRVPILDAGAGGRMVASKLAGELWQGGAQEFDPEAASKMASCGPGFRGGGLEA
jgi:hypothetical protein